MRWLARRRSGPIVRIVRRASPLAAVAEDTGFEPVRALTQHAFQACAIGL